MLNELLKKQKEELTLQIADKETLNTLNLDIENEIIRLEKDIIECEKRLKEKSDEYEKIKQYDRSHPFKTFIKKKFFSQKYNDNINSINADYQKKLDLKDSLISQKNSKEEEHRINQKKIAFIETLEKELSLLENEEYGIQRLIEKNPDILSNKDVMIDLIQKDMKYICIDKSDHEEVYYYSISKVLELITKELNDFICKKEQLLRDIDKCDESERKKRISLLDELDFLISLRKSVSDNLSYLIDEIKNSKVPENEKYKIPHKFLFEAIRKQILCEEQNLKKEINRDLTLFEIARSIADVSSRYSEIDCKFSHSYGKKIESLYVSEDVDLYFHGTSNASQFTVDNIFKNGLLLRQEYKHALFRTTLSQYQIGCDFLKCLNYHFGTGQTIVIGIPRTKYGVIGNNTNENDKTYILPQYVLGEIKFNSDGAEFVNNPIPIEERTVYNYTYLADKDLDEEKIKGTSR